MSVRLVGWVSGTGRLDWAIGPSTRVGATPDNEVVVRVDGVSRLHARIVEQPDGYWLEDAGSRNGTWVNGERATRTKLRHLDVITLGRFAELVFVARAAGDPVPQTPPALRVRLEWLNGPSRGEIVEIPRGETILGRAESCGIVVESTGVSRAHARITHTGESLMLEDLGSANGTAVNGLLLTGPVALDPGAEIDVGQDRRFRLLFDALPVNAASPGVQGATPIATQDMEWATRLVWSESDVQAVQAAVARGKATAAATPRPVAETPTPVPEVPVRAAPAPEATPAAVDPAPAQTQVVPPEFKLPAGATAGPGPVEPATILEDAGLGALPPPGGPGTAPGGRVDRTQLGGTPPSLRTGFAPAAQAAAQPGGGGPAPLTVLGHRDVAPTPRPPAFTDLPRERTGAPADSVGPLLAPGGDIDAPIEYARLSGDVGVFVLARGTATVGRSEQATVRIDSRDVSRIHAVLTINDRDVVVEDRGSVNGTTVNGTAVNGRAPLVHGDRVSFADFEFRIELQRTEATP